MLATPVLYGYPSRRRRHPQLDHRKYPYRLRFPALYGYGYLILFPKLGSDGTCKHVSEIVTAIAKPPVGQRPKKAVRAARESTSALEVGQTMRGMGTRRSPFNIKLPSVCCGYAARPCVGNCNALGVKGLEVQLARFWEVLHTCNCSENEDNDRVLPGCPTQRGLWDTNLKNTHLGYLEPKCFLEPSAT